MHLFFLLLLSNMLERACPVLKSDGLLITPPISTIAQTFLFVSLVEKVLAAGCDGLPRHVAEKPSRKWERILRAVKIEVTTLGLEDLRATDCAKLSVFTILIERVLHYPRFLFQVCEVGPLSCACLNSSPNPVTCSGDNSKVILTIAGSRHYYLR